VAMRHRSSERGQAADIDIHARGARGKLRRAV
jgi:hypothetical protein